MSTPTVTGADRKRARLTLRPGSVSVLLALAIEFARDREALKEIEVRWQRDAESHARILEESLERIDVLEAEFGVESGLLVDAKQRIEELEAALRGIWGYEPIEVIKDEFAYDRMVTAFKDAATAALASKEQEGEPE